MNYKDKKEINELIKNGRKNKIIAILGPCSISNIKYAIVYSKILKIFQRKLKKLIILMRIYLEKPRTTIGWKGYIYDPDINYSYRIKKGINNSIFLLNKINKKIKICTEFLNNSITKFILRYISIGTIGARNVNSQIHRELVSDLEIPIGYKNDINGNTNNAINSIFASNFSTICNYINKKQLKLKFKITKGNNNCFLILRGSEKKPNYYLKNIEKIIENNKKVKIMIDFSHGNSKKICKNQIKICNYFCKYLINIKNIIGILIESNISSGNIKLKKQMIFNKKKSLTDECLSIKKSFLIIKKINKMI
ncbi:MAG: 3-deoxy-7-phosphoheptulonate synthase [Candidatus Vidania fulgoroideorum]